MESTIPVEIVEKRIWSIRGHRVILDSDPAELYQVQTKVLLQAVKRNSERFPGDFMFQLTKGEFENLRSRIVTSSHPWLSSILARLKRVQSDHPCRIVTSRWGGRPKTRSASYMKNEIYQSVGHVMGERG